MFSKDFQTYFLWFFVPFSGPPGAEIWPECGPREQLLNPKISSKSGQWRPDSWQKAVKETKPQKTRKTLNFDEFLFCPTHFCLFGMPTCGGHRQMHTRAPGSARGVWGGLQGPGAVPKHKQGLGRSLFGRPGAQTLNIYRDLGRSLGAPPLAPPAPWCIFGGLRL